MSWWVWAALAIAFYAGWTFGAVLGANCRSELEDEIEHWRKRYDDVARDLEHA